MFICLYVCVTYILPYKFVCSQQSTACVCLRVMCAFCLSISVDFCCRCRCHCSCSATVAASDSCLPLFPPPHHFIFLAFALLRLLRLVLPLLWFHVNCSERRLFRQSALILKLDLQTTTSHCCCCWCCCCFAVAAQLQFAPQSTHNTHTYSISTHIAFSQRTIPFAVPT